MKKIVIFLWLVLLFISSGCLKQEAFSAERNEVNIGEMVQQGNFKVVTAESGITVNDLKVEIKKISIGQDAGMQMTTYSLIINTGIFYYGKGTGVMRDVFELAIYNSDLSSKKNEEERWKEKSGNIKLVNGRESYSNYYFEHDGWTIKPTNMRIFALVSNELFEITEYEDLIGF